MPLSCRKLAQNSGQALVEYALILALASLGIVSALIILQRSLGNSVEVSGRRIDAATGASAGQALPGQPLGGAPSEGRGTAKGSSGSRDENGGPNSRK
jgi:Flp pilus assembly pilin Flp